MTHGVVEHPHLRLELHLADAPLLLAGVHAAAATLPDLKGSPPGLGEQLEIMRTHLCKVKYK